MCRKAQHAKEVRYLSEAIHGICRMLPLCRIIEESLSNLLVHSMWNSYPELSHASSDHWTTSSNYYHLDMYIVPLPSPIEISDLYFFYTHLTQFNATNFE